MKKMLLLLAVLIFITGRALRPAVLSEGQPPLPVITLEQPAEAEPPARPDPLIPDWNLTLVNPWNPLSEDYTISLTQLKNGQAVDARCYPALQDMMDACRGAGLEPLICSSYRTQEKQERLFENKVSQFLAKGLSKESARTEAAKVVALPGTSEHQLGLAVDIVDAGYQLLDDGQADTPVQQWLMEHCWEYGFILRYPKEKEALTGIIYEPWHYRYVGKEHAQTIYDSGLCLEEYLNRITDQGRKV